MLEAVSIYSKIENLMRTNQVTRASVIVVLGINILLQIHIGRYIPDVWSYSLWQKNANLILKCEVLQEPTPPKICDRPGYSPPGT